MVIECQNCGARYRIDGKKIKAYLKYEIPCRKCNQPLDFHNQVDTSKMAQKLFNQEKNPIAENETTPQKDEVVFKEKKVKWHYSIQFKFSIILCIVMLVIFGFSTLINTAATKKQMTEDLSQLAQRTALRLSKSLVAPLWEIDEPQIHENILSEMMEENIYGITIKDNDRKTVLYGDKRIEDWLIDKTTSPIDGNFIFFSSEILKKDEFIGIVGVYVTRKFINHKIFSEIRNITITSVLLISSIFITTFLTMKKFYDL
jgi:predicted Zn finger-like uncharacterized protein